MKSDPTSAAAGTKSPTESPEAKPAKEGREKKPAAPADRAEAPKEIGGRDGPEPTRFGDWEVNGICVDF